MDARLAHLKWLMDMRSQQRGNTPPPVSILALFILIAPLTELCRWLAFHS